MYIYIYIGRALHTGSRNENNIGAEMEPRVLVGHIAVPHPGWNAHTPPLSFWMMIGFWKPPAAVLVGAFILP